MTDPLTGLPNRRSFTCELEEMLRKPESGPLAVLLLDVSDLAGFNARFGYEAGDELLRKLGRTWLSELPPGGMLARVGGGDFGMLLLRANVETITQTVERVRLVTPDVDVDVGWTSTTFQRPPTEPSGLLLAAAAVIDQARQALRLAKAHRRV